MTVEDKRLEADELAERLVPLADDGPAIPVTGAERVKAAVRPVWEREVSRLARRRRLRWSAAALAAAAAIAFAAIALWRAVTPPAAPIGHIEIARGAVTVGAEGKPQVVGPGARVRAGDAIRTGEADRAAVRLANGVLARLDVRTSVVVRSPEAFLLDSGTVYLESSTAETIEVRTPVGAVRDVGTRFEVRHRGHATRVRVREGSVFVIAAGEATRVESGRELVVDADGSLRAGTVAPHDAGWGWVLEVSPPFAIEGQTVRALLEWVERETGWEVRYADPAVEAAARNAVLHGALDGVRADEAPSLVLPSAGLEAVARNGTLFVRAMQ